MGRSSRPDNPQRICSLTSDQFSNFTSAVLGALQRDPNILGLIAVGSTAISRTRDQWSGHNFFIITKPGREDYYLESDAWLPEHHNVLLSTRHDAHYQTVLYANGHKVDCGVFEPGTAHQGKLDIYKVLLDRGGMSALAESVMNETRRLRREELQRPGKLANIAILAWTCHERVQRGEWLAGHKFLSLATDLTLDLFARHVADSVDDPSDLLDARRRLEKRSPELAGELRRILSAGSSAECAALLRLVERELRAVAPDLGWDELHTVTRWIESAG